MVEVGLPDPLRLAEGKSTCCGGEMDVDIPFEVSAEGMDSQKDARPKPFFVRPIIDDGCGDEGDTIHQVTIEPEEYPEGFRHGKGNVLPDSSGKGVKAVLNPDISGLLTAGRAESGFTAMRDFSTLRADKAEKQVVAEKSRFADEQF